MRHQHTNISEAFGRCCYVSFKLDYEGTEVGVLDNITQSTTPLLRLSSVFWNDQGIRRVEGQGTNHGCD